MQLTVAVTGLNSADNPAPGLAVARCLREAYPEVRIIGLGYDALDTGIHSRDLLDQVFLLPYPSEGELALYERLTEIHARTLFDLVIPTLDSELMGFCSLRRHLRKLGIRTLLPEPEVLQLRSKANLAQFCREHDLPHPETEVITSPDGLPAAVQKLGLPLVVKGLFHGAALAQSLDEARIRFREMERQWGLPIVLQRHYPGEEYDVVAAADRHGESLGMVAMRKLRVTAKGTAWAGVSVSHPELLELAERALGELGWAGPLEFEFLLGEKDREFRLLEINPRFPSWVYLAAAAGLNLPARVAEVALDISPDTGKAYQTGLTFVRHALDVVCPLSNLESLTMKGELVTHEL